MTRNEMWQLVNQEDTANLIFYLWERWHDENEFEDAQFNAGAYLGAIQKKIPSAYKMTKRPFGFFAKCDFGELRVTVVRKGDRIAIKAKAW